MSTPRRARARFVLLAFVSLVSLAAIAAEPAGTAAGKFVSKTKEFEVAGAYAFWSRSADDGPIINVAVSNYKFIAAAFDAFYDPRPVIESDFVDDQTAVVYFQFEPNGRYHGISYYLGSGDGCGFCSDPETKSTVKMTGRRLQGKLALKDPNRTFDIDIDVAVPPKDWGKPLAGDGGEVGAAFRAYHAALDKSDRKAIFDRLDTRGREQWKKAEKDGNLDDYIEYRTEKRHWRMKSPQIVGGFVRDNQAVLLVKASSSLLDHFHGQVALTRENGSWKVADEVYEVGE